MKTPLNVSLVTVAVNATLNVLAVWLLPVEWRHVGLAGSTVFCAFLGCVLLLVAARRKNGALGLGASVAYVLRVLVATTVMAAALLFFRPKLALPSPVTLAVAIAEGLAVYTLMALVLRIFRLPRRQVRPSDA